MEDKRLRAAMAFVLGNSRSTAAKGDKNMTEVDKRVVEQDMGDDETEDRHYV